MRVFWPLAELATTQQRAEQTCREPPLAHLEKNAPVLQSVQLSQWSVNVCCQLWVATSSWLTVFFGQCFEVAVSNPVRTSASRLLRRSGRSSGEGPEPHRGACAEAATAPCHAQVDQGRAHRCSHSFAGPLSQWLRGRSLPGRVRGAAG